MDIFSISVLLVEAEDGDSITRELLFEQTTFTLEWVASYDTALALVGRSQHDVYLFNYALDRYNGLDLLKEATLRGCQIPIILLIEPGVEVETEALQAGAADCLIKGQFDSRLLQRSICYAIERQKILRSLKESESRLESILRLRQEVVWSIAATTMKTLYISPAAQIVYSHSVAEFFDNPNLWLEVVHPSDRQAAINFSQSCLQPGSKDLEYRIIRPDGEVRWIHNQAYLVGDPIARRIDGIATDITERKQVEAETQKFVALVENSSDFIAMSSPEGKVLYLNAAGCQLVGLNSLQAAISKDMANYLFEDGLRQFCEMTLPQLMANERCEGEAQLRHFQTGKPIDVQRSCFCIRSPTGELLSNSTARHYPTQGRRGDTENAGICCEPG